MKANSKTLLIVATVVIALLAGGYFKVHQTRVSVARATPAIPDLGAHPAALAEAVRSVYSGFELGLNPKNAVGRLAQLYHSNGYIEPALACYDLLLEQLDPESGRWPHLKATILSGYGRTDEAIALWRQSIERDDAHFSAYAQLGNALIKREDWDAARTVFDRALERWSKEPYALVGRGRIELETGNLAGARGFLEDAARESRFKIGTDLLITVYQKLGEDSRAQSLLGGTSIGAYPQLPDPWLLETYDYCYDSYQLSVAGGHAAHAGDVDAGIRLLERAISLDPSNQMIHYQIGGLYVENGDLTSAENAFQTSVRIAPDFSDGWIQLFELHKSKGDRSAANRVLAQGYKNCPDSPGILLELADIRSEAKQWDEAIPLYQRSIQLRPNEAGAYLGLGRAYSSLNRPQDSIREIEKALQYEPAHPFALSSVAFWAIVTNDRPKAERFLKRIDAQPRVPSADRQQLHQKFQEQFGTPYRQQ